MTTKRTGRTQFVGPLTFGFVLVATLVFFWWFLLSDHGILPPA